jgi:hypothetical protein
LAQLKTDGVVGEDVVLQVATTNGWDKAIDAGGLTGGRTAYNWNVAVWRDPGCPVNRREQRKTTE